MRWVLTRACVAVALLTGCAELTARNIDELVVQDSMYFHPETLEPYTGPVFKRFDSDAGQVQLRARLEGGTFNGELVVYHRDGRLRFEGTMANGTQCGGWYENEDESPPDDEWEALKRDLESIVVYPACP